ncbi:hypothetical protein KCV03_g301, partial [Aureobasidium melanogenum]
MSMIKDQWVGRQKLAIEHPLMHQRIPFEKRITHRSMVDERTVERLDLLESQHWVAWPQGATIQSIVSQSCVWEEGREKRETHMRAIAGPQNILSQPLSRTAQQLVPTTALRMSLRSIGKWQLCMDKLLCRASRAAGRMDRTCHLGSRKNVTSTFRPLSSKPAVLGYQLYKSTVFMFTSSEAIEKNCCSSHVNSNHLASR